MTIFLARQKRYNVAEIRAHLETGLQAVGRQPHGTTAVIKPNLVNQSGPKSGCTTHPAVVEAIYGALSDRGFRRITIADGPSINRPVDEVFARSGMAALAARLGADLVNLNTAEGRPVPWKYGEIALPKVILDADCYVNVPKMKTHVRCGVTLSLKNQQGVVDYEEKRNNHKRGVDEPLGELGRVLRPDLIVLDGVQGMEGNGPTHGSRNAPGVFALGIDATEFDTVVADLMGFTPEDVPMIAWAGNGSTPDVRGASVDELRVPFQRPNQAEYQHRLKMRVWENIRSCNGCDLNLNHAKEAVRSKPVTMVRYGIPIIRKALAGRIDVVKGEQSRIPDDHGAMVFLGDCTAELAAENPGVFVPGCPPDPDAILDALARAGELE
jgi:uncharacterized protein (DUF362 family)